MIFNLAGQPVALSERLPVFRQITHPFMPPITSEYFFFSEDGLIWFSTARGLTSFDGSELLYYSSLQEANSFNLPRITAMTEDKRHNFYITTDAGFFYYDRIKASFLPLRYIFPGSYPPINPLFDVVYCDNNGRVYAGSLNNGLFVYDPRINKTNHYNLDSTRPDNWEERYLNTVRSFSPHATDPDKLWVGTFNGIYLFDKKSKAFSRHFEIINPGVYLPLSVAPEHYDIQKMDVADDSTIWFNTWANGFGRYNSVTGKAKLFLHDARLKTPQRYIGYIIPKFAKLSVGKYLLGIYDYKTAIFDTRTEKTVYFNVTPNDFTEEETRFVTNDRDGNTWMLQRGLLYTTMPERLRLQSVIVPNKTTVNFSKPQLQGVYFDTARQLFYAAFTGSIGVHVYDIDFHPVAIIPTPLVNNYYTYNCSMVTKITKDKAERYWAIGLENYMLRPGDQKFEPVEKLFPSLAWFKREDPYLDIITTRDGNILVRETPQKVYHINYRTLATDTIKSPLRQQESYEIKDPSVWYDSKRDMVYLVCKNELAQFNLDNKEMRIIPASSLFGSHLYNPNTCASTLDADGRIWFIIPSYGIRIIDPQLLTCTDSVPYGTRGLIRGNYTGLMGGDKNYMLLHSQNGIVVYNIARQQSFLFDHSNGLSAPDAKSFSYANGYMLIGHNSRFEFFKLSNLDNYTMSVRPHLNTILADTALVFKSNINGQVVPIHLPYYQNTLSFSFSAPEFLFPERIEYAYQLTPVDKDWQYTDYFNRKITYTKLTAGKYVFRIKAQMQGGNWQREPVEYTIIITPAWWQTSWFRFLCVFVAFVLLIYLSRQRIKNIREKEQQKTRHEKELLELEAKALRAQMNPHFIFNSLNSIKSLINKNENDKASGYLTTFSKLIRTLFQNSDKREVSLYEELETCRLYTELETMRFGEKVQFLFEVNPQLDIKDIKVPALILQPFIENAIWHGLVPKESGGKVVVTVQGQNGIVECIIDDNGIGRELSRQYKTNYETTHDSKGIGLTQSRLELDKLLNDRNDTITIIDKKNEEGNGTGTTVIITFKEP
jgi:Histidine kinase/Y_Y_Y domain